MPLSGCMSSPASMMSRLHDSQMRIKIPMKVGSLVT